MMFSSVILAGGQSRRMGQDKSLMPVAGVPLIERIMRALQPLGGDLVLVTNDPAKYSHLHVRTVPDMFPGTGSLGGLYSGLAASSGDLAVAVACDMPFLNTKLLAYLVTLSESVDAVVPDLSEGVLTPNAHSKAKQLELHPLHAVYRRTCLAPIQAQLQAGDLRMMGFFANIDVRYVGRNDIQRFDPNLRSFLNLNTPDDWSAAEKMALSH
jgi:molybdopterin-guanine dinucleotide biosynthesis protein A